MTSPPTRPAPAPEHRRGGSRHDLAGTGTLLRLALRRDRLLIPVWVILLAVLAVQSAAAVEQFYPTAADRADMARSTNANASMRAIYGPVFEPTLGAVSVWELLTTGTVLIAIVSMVIVVRHTREEEETGRQELISAAVVGHRAPLTAALLAAAVANAAAAVLIALGLMSIGLPTAGSVATGLTVGGTGMVFAAFAALAAQLTESARLAKGLTGAVLGAAFMLRAAGDSGTADGSSPLAWLSPLGWTRNVRPYADERFWVLLLMVALIAVVSAAAYELAGRRDVGASFLATRPGPAEGRIGGVYGLAWRLQRGSLLGWGTGFALGGFAFGAMADGADELIGDNEQSREIIERMGGAQGITDAFLAAMIGLFGMLAAVYAVSAVLRMRGEETSERAEPLLASVLPRLRWVSSHLVIAYAGSVVLLLVSGLTTGLGYGLAAGDTGQVWRVTGASLAQTPAVWLLAGAAVLLFGALPALSMAAWGLVVVVLVVGWIGPSLDLPQSVMNISPFTHLPKLPGAEVTAAPYLWLLLLAAVPLVAGIAAFRRRDIG
ncbi:ABC transporter permease [Streptomyces carminius]|uniref:ABC transporter permease n=1 Tax=Streptomyces carminius TaxID=2665496 RepID=UPI001E3855C2|nr:ABC transporter permease [Streptomyces carminius]